MAAITALLGGVAAEELIFNKTYDNLSGTLRAVDNLTLKMAISGMLGLELHFNDYRECKYSEKYYERLEDAFLKIKEECYEKAKARVINIDWAFQDGEIDFFFDPTDVIPPKNYEWVWQHNRHKAWGDMARA